MSDKSSIYEKPAEDLPTQPIRIAGDTRPIRLKPKEAGKPIAEEGASRPWLLGGLILGTATLIAIVAVVLVVYNRGGFSTLAVDLVAPAPVSASAPVDGSKPANTVQLPAATAIPSPTQAAAATALPGPNQAAVATAIPNLPQAAAVTSTAPGSAVSKAPLTALAFDQTQLDSFAIQLADLVVLSPATTWGQVSTYHKLADWATPGAAQALTAAGEQHMSGTGFRSQNTSTEIAAVTSTVHQFYSRDDAQKGVGLMTADVKTTLTSSLVTQTTLTLRNGVTAPVTLVTGSLPAGPSVNFIASYGNMVVNVAVGGADSSPAGLAALLNDGKTLGQQMLERVAGAATEQ
jgi:hypothetical protein